MRQVVTSPAVTSQPVTSQAITSADAEASAPLAQVGARRSSIDALRGFVIALMALDHVRDYFSSARYAPTDLTKTYPALFFTRLVTHLCAPTFVFLAGLSAYLLSRRLELRALRRFLVTRGLWLIALEFTVVNFVWTFNFDYSSGVFLQVIWVIGISMCILAALVSLPRVAIGAIAAVTMLGHNLLDPIAPARFGALAPLWNVLHVEGQTPFGFALYPVIPWFAVMAAGYWFGPTYARSPTPARIAARSGALLTLAFVAVRALNVYGDPTPWSAQANLTFTALSFLNVTKYPPSLSYLLLTLGPALLLLALFERAPSFKPLTVFGRVPLFAYVVHIAMAHALAGLAAWFSGYGTSVLTDAFASPPGWGLSLPGVYLAWAVVLALLYPACVWFANVKQTRAAWWLSYL